MKKLVVLLVVLVTAYGAQAQESIKFGLKAGGNLSMISGNEAPEVAYKVGFQAGGVLAYGFSEKFSLQAEVLFSQRNSKPENSAAEDGYGINYDAIGDPIIPNYTYAVISADAHPTPVKITSVDIPVLVQYRIHGFFLEGGPTFSMLLGGQEKKRFVLTNEFGHLKIVDKTYDLSSASTLQVGYAAGVGYRLQNGLALDLRYQRNLTYLYKETQLQLSGVQLSMGYTFRQK